MNIIQLTEDYLGDELTPETATRFTEPDVPLDHLAGYLGKAGRYYYDWLENEEKKSDLRKTTDLPSSRSLSSAQTPGRTPG